MLVWSYRVKHCTYVYDLVWRQSSSQQDSLKQSLDRGICTSRTAMAEAGEETEGKCVLTVICGKYSRHTAMIDPMTWNSLEWIYLSPSLHLYAWFESVVHICCHVRRVSVQHLRNSFRNTFKLEIDQYLCLHLRNQYRCNHPLNPMAYTWKWICLSKQFVSKMPFELSANYPHVNAPLCPQPTYEDGQLHGKQKPHAVIDKVGTVLGQKYIDYWFVHALLGCQPHQSLALLLLFCRLTCLTYPLSCAILSMPFKARKSTLLCILVPLWPFSCLLLPAAPPMWSQTICH